MAPVDDIKASPLHIIGNSTNINKIITTTFITIISRLSQVAALAEVIPSHWRRYLYYQYYYYYYYYMTSTCLNNITPLIRGTLDGLEGEE